MINPLRRLIEHSFPIFFRNQPFRNFDVIFIVGERPVGAEHELIIVADGVLFGSSKAHKDIRTEIVENQRLEAVISMPSGVFKPYAGVSTAILVFTKTEHGGTDNVWFYDMKADGFSLDDKRAVVSENDITDIIKRFKNREQEIDRKRTEVEYRALIYQTQTYRKCLYLLKRMLSTLHQ